MVVNVDRYGNTSSGSIPLALADAAATGACEPGSLVLMTGMGAGLTWGSALMRLDTSDEWSEQMSKLAFMFPGQGSFELGMGREIAEATPEAMAVYDEGSEASGLDLRQLCFEGTAEELTRTDLQQPALVDDEPRDQRGAARARDRAGLRRRPLGRRVLRARRGATRSGCARRSSSCASAGSRWPRRRSAAARARWPRSSGSPTRWSRRSARRSTTSGRRTTTAPASSSSPARPPRSTSAAPRPSSRARAAPCGCKVSGAFHSPLVELAAERLRPAIERIDFKAPTAHFVSTVTAKLEDAAALPRRCSSSS